MSTPQLPRLAQSESQSQVSLYGAKMARKQLAEELKKIENRISMLATEQRKMNKKIESTEQKAYNLYLIKKNKADEQKEQKIREQQAQPPPFSYPLYLKQKETLKKIKDEERQKKYQEAQMVRQEVIWSLDQTRKEQGEQLFGLKEKAQQIRRSEQISQQIAEQKLREKRDKVRSEIYVEAGEVYEDNAYFDQMIKKLEQEEYSALRQLQETQTRHKNTSEKLTQAKQLAPQQFASKYLTAPVETQR